MPTGFTVVRIDHGNDDNRPNRFAVC